MAKAKLTKNIEYWTRQTGRIILLLIAIFVLLLLIAGIIWIIPKIFGALF